MVGQLHDTTIERPVTQYIVQCLQRIIITPQDVTHTPDLLFAPVAVPGNAERNIISQEQIIQFPKHHYLKVIQWHCDLVGLETNFPSHIIDYIHEHNSSSQTTTFVYVAPGYLKENLDTLKRIVNGAPFTLHSLSRIYPND